MTNREIAITRFVRSRGCALLLTLVAISFVAVSDIRYPEALSNADFGMLFPSSNTWLQSASLSVAVACIINLMIAVMMVILNRSYNMLRTVSLSYAGLFLLMQASATRLTDHLCDGLLLGVGILSAMALLYSSYLQRDATHRVFLAFLIIGTGALWRLSWLAFIPAFTGGLIQMRIFSFRMILAAVIGLISPLWIVWGSGLADPLQCPLPDFTFDQMMLLDDPQMKQIVAAGCLSLVTGTLFGIINIFKILSYNAAKRAYNGLLYTISITIGILTVIDWMHMSLYITLLNVCAAYQAGHFLKINYHRRGYLPILIVIAAYCVLFVTTMFVPVIWV